MLEKSLAQLEQLVKELLQRNQALADSNDQLSAELLLVKTENEDLQLSALEQEEKYAAAVARVKSLVDLAAAGKAPVGSGGV